jgi:hypothetical protein
MPLEVLAIKVHAQAAFQIQRISGISQIGAKTRDKGLKADDR